MGKVLEGQPFAEEVTCITMEARIAIVADTNSGISPELAEKLGVYLVAMPVIVDNETYFEYETISQETFFERLRQGAEVSTSQPAPGILTDLWDHLLERYEELVYIPMSSALSGSCQTAQMLAQDYDGRVVVVDNRRISVVQFQSVLEAKRLAEQGMSARQIGDYLQKDSLEVSVYVAVNTLELLKKSGRVTAAGAAIATVLNIKPVLQIQGGKLDAFKKGRGMKQAMQIMIDRLREDRAERFGGEKIAIRAAFAGDAQMGAAWREELQAAFPDVSVSLDPLPLSICCHTGEGAMGAGIMKDIL